MSVELATVYNQCILNRLESGILQFTFTAATRQAVDQWAAQMSAVYANAPRDIKLRILVDNTLTGMMPMSYVLQRSRQMIGHHPVRPPSRTALVVRQASLVGIVSPLIEALTRKEDALKFFASSERDTAIQWLLADN